MLAHYYKKGGVLGNPDLKKAAELFSKATEQGHADSMYELGKLSEEGYGDVPPNQETAFNYYRAAAKNGSTNGAFKHATYLLSANNISQEKRNEGLKYLGIAAKRNHAKAINNVGIILLSGVHGQKVNKPKAFKYFKEAADKGLGLATAQCNVARCYGKGIGIERDLKLAFEYCTRAANLKYAEGQVMLAFCYWQGVRGENFELQKDFKKFMDLLKAAAKQGHSKALFYLGYCYKHGDKSGPIDANIAYENFIKDEEQNTGKAQNRLGIWLADGLEKDETASPEDFQLPIQCFKEAVRQNYAPALFNLGWRYGKGKGVQQDLKLAFLYFEKAALQDFAPALFNLGISYSTGKGVPRDYKLAFQNFEKAAHQDHMLAQYNLGCCYGKGVPRDLKLAFLYFQKAAHKKYAPALFNLGCYYRDGGGCQQDHKLAFLNFQKAAEKNLPKALLNLGYCYENGIGIEEKSIPDAIKCYEKAAGLKVPEALNNLGMLLEDNENNPEIKSNTTTFDCYTEAANLGYAPALVNLAIWYLDQKDRPDAREKAIPFLKKAAKQNNQGAIKLLKELGEQVPSPKAPATVTLAAAASAIGQFAMRVEGPQTDISTMQIDSRGPSGSSNSKDTAQPSPANQ